MSEKVISIEAKLNERRYLNNNRFSLIQIGEYKHVQDIINQKYFTGREKDNTTEWSHRSQDEEGKTIQVPVTDEDLIQSLNHLAYQEEIKPREKTKVLNPSKRNNLILFPMST